jgi:hypothetical protein
MGYEFRRPSLVWPSELWRILTRVMAGTLTVPLVELKNKCTVTIATTVLFVSRERDFSFML